MIMIKQIGMGKDSRNIPCGVSGTLVSNKDVGFRYFTIGELTKSETTAAVSEKIDRWLDGKLFLYNNEYSSRWEQIFNDIKELLKLDVRLFILDNLFSMDIDIFDGDKNNKQRVAEVEEELKRIRRVIDEFNKNARFYERKLKI